MRVNKMMVVVVVMVVIGLCYLSVSAPKQNLPEGRLNAVTRQTTKEQRMMMMMMEEEEEKRWRRRRIEEGRGDTTPEGRKEQQETKRNKEGANRTKREEEEEGEEERKKEEEEKEENKKKTKNTKGSREGEQGMGRRGEERGGGGGGGEGRKKNIRRDYWADELEEYSPSAINLLEMREDMEGRRRRLGERCEETLTPEERRKEVNSNEFLINEKYKLIWCNIFKAASSTWMYNYLRMAGKTPNELQSLRKSPVEAARELYPRPSPGELLAHLGSEGKEKGYLSFLIVREPFQRLLSAYRDKIETELRYYRPLRCQITRDYPNTDTWTLITRNTCRPTFSQFVSYVLGEEAKGHSHNEHWAPYYRFCSTCSVHFDLILRFERLHQDEVYLLSEVAGLSQVVSPKVMHSSHTNYTATTARYFQQLSAKQVVGLLKIYLPDFRLFGYNERPYLDYVL